METLEERAKEREEKVRKEVEGVSAIYDEKCQKWDLSIEPWLREKVERVETHLGKSRSSKPSKKLVPHWNWLIKIPKQAFGLGRVKEDYAVRIRYTVKPLVEEVDSIELQIEKKRADRVDVDLQKFFDSEKHRMN